VQFWWCLHEPQSAIVFDSRCHAASQRKDQFRAGEALHRDAEVRHANIRTAFCTDCCQLLVRNRLHPLIGSHHNVARGQVLLKWQPVAKVAVARHGANPILLVEPFRLKVHRQEPVINVENKIKLPASSPAGYRRPPRQAIPKPTNRQQGTPLLNRTLKLALMGC